MKGNKPKLETKKINGVEISNFEVARIRVICDYLFVDRLNDMATFPRFEKCFGPLFYNCSMKNFSLGDAFKEICGQKKKYISFRRMIKAFLLYKEKKSKNESFNYFMEEVFEKILKKREDVIGECIESQQIYFTKNSENRYSISKFGVFTDNKKNDINGFSVEFDNNYTVCLSGKSDDSFKGLEINLLPYDANIEVGKIECDRDGISHIAGLYDKEKKVISFLIFKCRNGKTFFIGNNSLRDPKTTEPFLFGTSRCQLKLLRVELTKGLLNFMEPTFEKSTRVNNNLMKPFKEIDEKFLEEDKLLYEEAKLQNMKDINENTLLIPAIKDEHFIEPGSLNEKNEGKLFNEICSCCSTSGKKEEIKIEDLLTEANKFCENQKGIREEEKKKDSKFVSNAEFLESNQDFDALLAKIDSFKLTE